MPIPTFLIVGAAKSGTTSLYHYLKQHPDIFMPKMKEPHYFAKFDDKVCKNKFHFIRSWDEYLNLFKLALNEKAVGESSVSYLCHQGTAKRIKSKLPDVKIIIILRNPVERLFSHFMMDIRDGKRAEDSDLLKTVFEDAKIKQKEWGQSDLYLECGLYTKQVAEYFDAFGRNNVKIVLYEDFRDNPATIMSKLYKFLDVDSNFIPDMDQTYNAYAKPRSSLLAATYNSYRIRRIGKLLFPDSWKRRILHLFLKPANKPSITLEESKQLQEFYHNNVEELQKLLGIDLSLWKI